MTQHVVVIGAGIGGLSAASRLASEGYRVTVVEKAAAPGGKARQVMVDGVGIDAGPTVLTLRDVFEEIFDRAGHSLNEFVATQPATILARHAWGEGEALDLFADPARSEDAIAAFAGNREAKGFRRFSKDAAKAYEVLNEPFMRADKPGNPLALSSRIGFGSLAAQLAIKPFTSLWSALGSYFQDPRLRQLFGRYATYCGSSPFEAPGTLMLIAHVEAMGVWLVEGGISQLAAGLVALGEKQGIAYRFESEVEEIAFDADRPAGVTLAGGERISSDAVIVNADISALGTGRFGKAARRAVQPIAKRERSLSALVWCAHGKTSGFDLVRHNVFFSPDYAREFRELSRGEPPGDPTVYVCAQDRDAESGAHAGAHAGAHTGRRERPQIIVNAPANGDSHTYTPEEEERCTEAMMRSLERCGLQLEEPLPHSLATPNTFEALWPSTGGAIYGQASHGWAASFRRQGARTRIPWLYCAGGSTHPGAGVPMAALSGQQAALAAMHDLASMRRSHKVATPGGTSMRSATTGSTG